MAHVFIAYKREDRNFAVDLKDRLEKANIATWMDESIPEGRKWREEIDKQLRECFAIIVVITPEAMQSIYVQYEWMFALGAGKEVIPLNLRATNLPYRLDEIQLMDFTREYQWDRLISKLNHIKNEAKLINGASAQMISNAPVYNVMSVIDDLNSEDLRLRVGAARVLGGLKEKSAVQMLVQQINNRWDVAVEAIKALGDIGDKSVVPKLVAKLHSLTNDIEFEGDENGYIDSRADILLALVNTLGRLEDTLAFEPIKGIYNLYTYEHAHTLRELALRALIRIDAETAKTYISWHMNFYYRKFEEIKWTVWILYNYEDSELKLLATQFCEKHPEYADFIKDMIDIPF